MKELMRSTVANATTIEVKKEVYFTKKLWKV